MTILISDSDCGSGWGAGRNRREIYHDRKGKRRGPGTGVNLKTTDVNDLLRLYGMKTLGAGQAGPRSAPPVVDVPPAK
jgi:hypothetical protein